jgi:hypothetical protein
VNIRSTSEPAGAWRGQGDNDDDDDDNDDDVESNDVGYATQPTCHGRAMAGRSKVMQNEPTQ